MRVLITGANGQLGNALTDFLQLKKVVVYAFGKDQLDILQINDLRNAIEYSKPTHIINCSAFTDVKEAELNKSLCYSTNVNGINNLTSLSSDYNIKLIHFSTDYVFDGKKKDGIYYEDSITNPLNYYGYTKLISEQIIIKTFTNFAIIRTSWLYGNSNYDFVSKIISLAEKGKEIIVKDDEFGSPTYVMDLVEFTFEVMEMNLVGIIHFSNLGLVSRFEFAKKIIELFEYNNKVVSTKKAFDNVKRPHKVQLLSNKGYNIKNRNWEDAFCSYYIDVKKRDEIDPYINRRPKISVVMAVFNGERFLNIQINSILKQLKAFDEFIIVDDNSSDHSSKIISSYNSNFITYKKNQQNLGVNKSFEVGIGIASNEFIFLSDQDDLWSSDRLLYMLSSFGSDISVVVGNSAPINSNGKVINFNLNQTVGYNNQTINNALRLFDGLTPIYGCTMAFSSNIKSLILPFPKFIESHDLWIGLFAILNSSIEFVEGIVLFRRIHEFNASLKSRNLLAKLNSRIIFIKMVIYMGFRIIKSKAIKSF